MAKLVYSSARLCFERVFVNVFSGCFAKSWNESNEETGLTNFPSYEAENKPYLVTSPTIFSPFGEVIVASKFLISLPATISSK